MPNGHENNRDRVWRASRCWGVVWQVGDASYYVGLFISIPGPLTIVVSRVLFFQSLNHLAWGFLLGLIAFLLGLPLGLAASGLLKGVSEQMAGFPPDHDQKSN